MGSLPGILSGDVKSYTKHVDVWMNNIFCLK